MPQEQDQEDQLYQDYKSDARDYAEDADYDGLRLEIERKFDELFDPLDDD